MRVSGDGIDQLTGSTLAPSDDRWVDARSGPSMKELLVFVGAMVFGVWLMTTIRNSYPAFHTPFAILAFYVAPMVSVAWSVRKLDSHRRWRALIRRVVPLAVWPAPLGAWAVLVGRIPDSWVGYALVVAIVLTLVLIVWAHRHRNWDETD